MWTECWLQRELCTDGARAPQRDSRRFVFILDGAVEAGVWVNSTESGGADKRVSAENGASAVWLLNSMFTPGLDTCAQAATANEKSI